MKKGFSLIEIIIVVMIMTVLLGAATVSYQRSQEEKKVERDASKVADLIEEARDKTINRELPPGANASCNTAFEGYQVYFTQPNNYRLRYSCNGVIYTLINYRLLFSEIYSLPSRRVSFSYPYGRVNNVFNVEFALPQSPTACRVLTVDESGNSKVDVCAP